MKKSIVIFILIFSMFLVSCSGPVTYSVAKEHKNKIEAVYNMISGLVEGDKDAYLEAFEPSYITTLKKSFDTTGSQPFLSELGYQYRDVANFDELMKVFFDMNAIALESNYGEKISVDISLESCTDVSLSSINDSLDVNYTLYSIPKDAKGAVQLSANLDISGEKGKTTVQHTFNLIQLSDDSWYIHPKFFLYTI
jgi:hypothetical protein